MNESLDQKIRHRNAVARAHTQASIGQTTKLIIKETPLYTGRAREIFPIVLVNAVLTFLTVGIYRFWAKTRMRRYFVSRVSFLGDPLEYSGTGMELFIGFLIVLAVLVPITIVTGFLQNFLARPGTDPISLAIFQAGYLTVFYFLYNFAVYRAQRYRLSRISWRGIRGGQQGSALVYACYGLTLGLVTLATLGLFYPVMRRLLVGYRINRACFGATACEIKGGTLPLFAAWLIPWALIVALWATFAYAAWSVELAHPAARESIADAEAMFSDIGRQYRHVFIALGALVPIALFWYRTFEMRQWFKRTRFDQLAFESRLNLFHILLPYVAYLAVMALVVGAVVWGGAGAFSTISPWFASKLDIGSTVMIAMAAFVAVWIVGSLLQPIIVLNWLIRNVCRTLTIQGSFSPDRLFQNQLDIPTRGEGLADALDVDAF